MNRGNADLEAIYTSLFHCYISIQIRDALIGKSAICIEAYGKVCHSIPHS